MLLMHLLNETHLEKDVRARMYLEILGNTLITEATGAWIRKTSGKFAGIISSGSSDILESSWDLGHLKDKEKEKMVEVFKMWREGAERKNIIEFWTARQQKLLGNICSVNILPFFRIYLKVRDMNKERVWQIWIITCS